MSQTNRGNYYSDGAENFILESVSNMYASSHLMKILHVFSKFSRHVDQFVCLQSTGGITICFLNVILHQKTLKTFKLFMLPASYTSSKLNLYIQINSQVFDLATNFRFLRFAKAYTKVDLGVFV